jgi:hypothetical protein
MKRSLVGLLFCLFGFMVNGQGIDSFSPAEKAVLNILTREGSSKVVTVLPMKYRFGIRDLSFDRLSILKSADRIFFLPDGQDAVFEWMEEKGRLVRIDSSRFGGSNFGMMPFLRNGEPWQFGGYGFWRSRNMFTRFDEGSGEWKFEFADSSVSGHLTMYFYDASSEAFYMCGSYRNRPHDMHRTEFRDMVYVFDFTQQKWSSLGKLSFVSNPAELSSMLHTVNIATCDAGLIHVMGSQTTLYNFRHNLYSRIRVGSDTALIRISGESGWFDRQLEHSIMMGDSMYIIHANEKEARVNTLYLHASMFEKIGQIWGTEERVNGLLSAGWRFALIMIVFLSLVVIGSYSSKKSDFRKYFRLGKKPTVPLSASSGKDEWSVFWKGLRTGHQILLRSLVFEGDPLKGVDTETVNHILGIARRPASLQKVHRNRAVQSINQVYQQTFRTDALLIRRLREPGDRRQTRFYISREDMEVIRRNISSIT